MMEVLTLFISLFVAAFAFYVYRKHENELEEQSSLIKRLSLEKHQEDPFSERKALLKALLIKGERGIRTIRVYNNGKSMARAVIIHFPEHNGIKVLRNPSPADIMPQQAVEIPLQLYGGYPDKLQISIRWNDDFRDVNEKSEEIIL